MIKINLLREKKPKRADKGQQSIMAGFLGILFAVPTLAVLKVLFDFLRARMYTEDVSAAAASTPPQAQEPDT